MTHTIRVRRLKPLVWFFRFGLKPRSYQPYRLFLMFAKYFQASGVERRTMLESRGTEIIPVTPEQVFEVSLMGCDENYQDAYDAGTDLIASIADAELLKEVARRWLGKNTNWFEPLEVFINGLGCNYVVDQSFLLSLLKEFTPWVKTRFLKYTLIDAIVNLEALPQEQITEAINPFLNDGDKAIAEYAQLSLGTYLGNSGLGLP